MWTMPCACVVSLRDPINRRRCRGRSRPGFAATVSGARHHRLNRSAAKNMQPQLGAQPANPFQGLTGWWEPAPPIAEEPTADEAAPARRLWNTDRTERCVSDLHWIMKRQSLSHAAARRTPCRTRSLTEPAPLRSASSATCMLRRCASSAVMVGWSSTRPDDDAQAVSWPSGIRGGSRRAQAARTATRSASLPARYRRD